MWFGFLIGVWVGLFALIFLSQQTYPKKPKPTKQKKS